MGQLTEIFRQQEELARQMSLEGGYITDVYMLCKTPEGLKVAETAVPQAFHGMTEVVTPVQTRKLGPEEQQHIRQHIAAWTPCATFVSNLDGNDEIYLTGSGGKGVPQRLTRNRWEWDKGPAWSPDGRQIAFWPNRTGNKQIWVMDADGQNPRSAALRKGA